MQREVGGGHPFRELACHVYADNFGNFEIYGLPEHSGFRFNAPYAPADNSEPVNHRRVRVRAHERVGVEYFFALRRFGAEHEPREIFQIHLVNNAG